MPAWSLLSALRALVDAQPHSYERSDAQISQFRPSRRCGAVLRKPQWKRNRKPSSALQRRARDASRLAPPRQSTVSDVRLNASRCRRWRVRLRQHHYKFHEELARHPHALGGCSDVDAAREWPSHDSNIRAELMMMIDSPDQPGSLAPRVKLATRVKSQ